MTKDAIIAQLIDHLDYAWTIIANAHGGDWRLGSPEWVNSAERWRDTYYQILEQKQKRENELTQI